MGRRFGYSESWKEDSHVRGPFYRSTVVFLLIAFVVVLSSCRTAPERKEIAIEYHNIAHAYFELGRFDHSARYFARAIELDPSLARTSYNLARIRIEQKRFTEADEILSTMLAADPENVLVLKTRGYARFASARFDEARVDLTRAAELSPFDADIPYNIGLIEKHSERYESAFRAFSRARTLAPSDPDAIFFAAIAAGFLDDSSAFTEAAEAYMALTNRSDSRIKQIAAGYEKSEMFDRALAAYETVIARSNTDAEARFGAARVLLIAIEDEERGLEYLTRAISDGFSDAQEAEALANRVPERLAERVRAVTSPLAEPVAPESDVPADEPATESRVESRPSSAE